MRKKELQERLYILEEKYENLNNNLRKLKYEVLGTPYGIVCFGKYGTAKPKLEGAIPKLEEYLGIKWVKETEEGYKKIKKN